MDSSVVGYDGARNVKGKERCVAAETDPAPASEREQRSKEHSSSIPTKAVVLAAFVLVGIIVYGYLDTEWSENHEPHESAHLNF